MARGATPRWGYGTTDHRPLLKRECGERLVRSVLNRGNIEMPHAPHIKLLEAAQARSGWNAQEKKMLWETLDMMLRAQKVRYDAVLAAAASGTGRDGQEFERDQLKAMWRGNAKLRWC